MKAKSKFNGTNGEPVLTVQIVKGEQYNFEKKKL